MDQRIAKIAPRGIRNESAMGELREAITSGEFYLVTLPAWCDWATVLILKGEKISSVLAATILNIRHEGFLQFLDEGRMPFEKNGSEVLVDSNDFMKFREEWEKEAATAMDRLYQIDSEEDYI